MKKTRQVSARIPEQHAQGLEKLAEEISSEFARATVADALRMVVARGLSLAMHEARTTKRGRA